MKISKQELRELIREIAHTADAPGRDLGYGEGEGRSTKAQLFQVAEYAAVLHEMIQDDDDLPEWVQNKIAVMTSNIGKIKHYLEYKIARDHS
tara:strand:- start:295 stop:570 length:276 start_codon:yes stop_codon:yes gene_type:complete